VLSEFFLGTLTTQIHVLAALQLPTLSTFQATKCVTMDFQLEQGTAADVFFRAFKDCVDNILSTMPTDINNPEASHAIQIIAQQLNGDYARLEYVSKVLQLRIYEDLEWANISAVHVYEMLALAIDPDFSVPGRPVRGAYLVRRELMKVCQTQFQQMLQEPIWSKGLMAFLGRLCTVGNMTSTTPGIVLDILDNLIASPSLEAGNNFDILTGFLLRAGPFLDSQVTQVACSTRLQQLQDRARGLKLSDRLAVYGLAQLRQREWALEELDGDIQ
jgi:hypothetical protein